VRSGTDPGRADARDIDDRTFRVAVVFGNRGDTGAGEGSKRRDGDKAILLGLLPSEPVLDDSMPRAITTKRPMQAQGK